MWIITHSLFQWHCIAKLPLSSDICSTFNGYYYITVLLCKSYSVFNALQIFYALQILTDSRMSTLDTVLFP